MTATTTITTSNQKIFVTGTSGFIGGRLVEVLYLSQAAAVRASVRSWSSAARIARFPVEIVRCDIMDQDQIAEAMAGATAVVHCAYSDTHAAIVQGTQNMLEVAHKLGVERFVYLSTAEVYGNQVRGPIDETAPYQSTGSEYADSKIEAEQLCLAYSAKGLPVTILRPSIVYGPFGESWTVNVAKRLQSGNWGTFEAYGEGKCNLVYVDDLVAAILLAIRQPDAVGEVFNINGPDILTWNQYFQRFNDALGLPSLPKIASGQSTVKSVVRDRINNFTGFFLDRYKEPLMDIYLRGGVISKVMKGVKNSLHSTPSVNELQNLYSRDAYYVATKAQERLGYKPKFSLETGLRLSILWLDHFGFLPQTSTRPVDATNNNQKIYESKPGQDFSQSVPTRSAQV